MKVSARELKALGIYPSQLKAAQAAIRESNQKSSRLLKLPAELRNRIYELVLVDTKPIIVLHHIICYSPALTLCTLRADPGMMQDRLQQPALTRVSQSIRAETLPIFYGRNVFLIYCHAICAGVRYGLTWLAAIGDRNRQSLKQLYLNHKQEKYCSKTYLGSHQKFECQVVATPVVPPERIIGRKDLAEECLKLTFGGT